MLEVARPRVWLKCLLFTVSSGVFLPLSGFAASSDEPDEVGMAAYSAEDLESGRQRFAADCGFCHGRDARGGSRGLDLTRSELVAEDVEGNLIGDVVRAGRLDKGMPAFPAINGSDLSDIAAYIHNQKMIADTAEGGRRSVEPEDLLVGNIESGREYFDSACSSCHSASGDLKGVASRFEGLALLRRLLYPGARSRPPFIVVSAQDGQEFSGAQAYRDEFTIAIRDQAGVYRSWATRDVSFTVDNPLQAHIDQLPLYTDADMHDVYAYIQTLR